MQVYKTFFKIAKKYSSGCLIYLTVFMIIMVSMSFISSDDSNNKFSASSVKFTVIDEDKTPASQALIHYLSEKHEYVEFNSYDKETLQDNLFYEEIRYILNIPKGYETNLKNQQFDNLLSHTMKTDSAAGYFFNQDLDSYINNIRLNLLGGFTLEEALKETQETIKSTDSSVETIEFEKTTANKDINFFYYLQYFSYIAISILIIGISPILIAFHKSDLNARIACSSYSRTKQSVMVGLGCLTCSFGQWLFLMICALVIFGPTHVLSTNGLFGILNSFVYTIVIIAITLLVGSFNLNSAALSLVSNIISLGTSFLCGVFVPLWYLSDKVTAFSRFLPSYWYIRNNNMLSGLSGESLVMNSYWTNLLIQILFAVALFSIYLVVNLSHQRKHVN